MNEIAFKRIIIISSIIGLILLIIYSLFFVPKEQTIYNLSNLKEGTIISVTGIIKDVSVNNNFITFSFCENTSCIQSILFNPSSKQADLITKYSTTKERVVISGQYKKYMDIPEIIIYNIKKI
ncbi:MAG: hypothetical protein WCF78_02965 [archaeon]